MSAETKLQHFVTQQKRLLTLELHADQDEATDINTKSNSGFFLRNVDVIETSVGLYGRTVVLFGQNENTAVGISSSNNNSDNVSSSSRRSLLDAHRLTVGDEIEILPKNGKGSRSSSPNAKRVGGVVCAVDDHSISIALEDRKQRHNNLNNNNNSNIGKQSSKKSSENEQQDLDEESDMFGGSPPYTLVPRSGVEVHQKMIASLDELEKYGVNHPVAGDVILSAFEPSRISLGADTDPMTKTRTDELEKEYHLANTKLDYSQKEAVVFALDSQYPISLIHGPPGTGKTTTVAELIRCAVNIKNWKVLVTAPSNVAVDNILERMIALENELTQKSGKRKNSKKKSTQRIIPCRLGHPSRIQQSIQKYSLESLVQSSEGTEIVQDCRRELNVHLRTLSNPKSRPSEKRVAYSEMKSLRKEIRQREEKVVGEILRHANVVLATNVGAAGSVFKRMVDIKGEPISFDLVIIDEAAQALEASCWISLLRGKRAVLAGDHCQLPPTIKCSNREVQSELGKTLFERLMRVYDGGKNEASPKPSKMLKVQYRMHENIADWASNAMYHGKLISHDSVKYRKLSSLPQVQEQLKSKELVKDTEAPAAALQDNTLTLIDTAGCGFNEMKTDAGSRYNEGEAELVIAHVRSLLALGLRAEDIAVITPYNGQVELLRKRLLIDVPKLEIRSVDGFQGGEREAVVLSLVRSSERGGKDGIGFLRDERRLNVAVTRAKRHLALICDCETVSQNKFIKGLIEWMEEKGDYRSGAELVDSTPGETGTYAATLTVATKIKPTNIAEKVQQTSDTKMNKCIKSLVDQPTELTKSSTSHQMLKDNSPEELTKSIESQDSLKEGDRRRALMNKVSQFAETQPKGNELVLTDLPDFDLV
eukprot:scaffold147867_cov49-Cyclotella_meneghiniana.AAC.1